MLRRIYAISRAVRYSPNSVEKDAGILLGVCHELIRKGYDVVTVGEEAVPADEEAVAYVTMGRSNAALHALRERELAGALVVNNPAAVALCCNRRRLDTLLKSADVPVPSDSGRYGYWLKRADGVAESPFDVIYAAGIDEAMSKKRDMEAGGIRDVLVQAHVQGDLVKFYGVNGTSFFRYYYPGDDGQWKFGDEGRNGTPQHFDFCVDELHAVAGRAAAVTGTDVYGGDCIVGVDGKLTIIDFNDWPSFSRCRDEAALAIATMVDTRIGNMRRP